MRSHPPRQNNRVTSSHRVVVPGRSVSQRGASDEGVMPVAAPRKPTPIVDGTSYLSPPTRKIEGRPLASQTPNTHIQKRLGQTAKHTELLARAVDSSKPSAKKSIRQRIVTPRNILTILAILLLLLSAYVSVDTWLTNRAIQTQSSGLVSDESASSHQDQEGRDESELPASALSSYRTAADVPRAVYIDKLNVSARLQPMGVNDDGSMQAPRNIFDAGWYTGSAKPSKGGAVVVNAHASGPTREGLFAYLDTLVEGDQIVIETGDDTKYTYEVIGRETVDLEDVDMKKLMLPQGSAIQAANFITCSGKWQADEQTFSERTLIYTKLVK